MDDRERQQIEDLNIFSRHHAQCGEYYHALAGVPAAEVEAFLGGTPSMSLEKKPVPAEDEQ